MQKGDHPIVNNRVQKDMGLRLKIVLAAFFVFAVLFALTVYIADPSIYAKTLPLQPTPTGQVLMTLFLVAIVGFIAVLCLGVVRHWRWVFWLVLVAFGASTLEIPATILQLVGVVPHLFPVWYSLVRMGVAVIQVAIAVWMLQIYRRYGVWAMGKKKASQ